MAEPPRRDRALTRREFDEVIRRASELAMNDVGEDDGDTVPEAEVYRIARDVGLPEVHVRTALAEMSAAGEIVAGAEASTWVDRFWGPQTLRAARVVPGSPESLARKIDEYMVGGRLLQPVRRTPGFMQYRPAVDWMSQVARAASGTARRYYVASARSVEVHLQPVDDHRTHVALNVDAGVRGNYVSGGIIGGIGAGAGAGVGAFAALMAAGVAPILAGVAVGAAFALPLYAVNRLTAKAHREKLYDVQAELEGVLDLLEAGGAPEPPPPSWRKWIERRFHGARRLLEAEDPALVDLWSDDDAPKK